MRSFETTSFNVPKELFGVTGWFRQTVSNSASSFPRNYFNQVHFFLTIKLTWIHWVASSLHFIHEWLETQNEENSFGFQMIVNCICKNIITILILLLLHSLPSALRIYIQCILHSHYKWIEVINERYPFTTRFLFIIEWKGEIMAPQEPNSDGGTWIFLRSQKNTWGMVPCIEQKSKQN